ncbi:MAG TPA: hypothetical protein VE954_08600 [Oligoflexus sp.]|uniref:hypothetical protein n=1 Tax=Oligoflexus sp. TaxID=1971216 RepID=UPI002D621D30|nr:hypothetical protein [Oligoflexus sp.]HYX33162.1 hypothetical protein [Oligoflexus sp.]
MLRRMLVAMAFQGLTQSLLAAPADFERIISIQQSQIIALKSQLAEIRKPIVIPTTLAGGLLGNGANCYTVCRRLDTVCLDGRLRKIDREELLLGRENSLGCFEGPSTGKSLEVRCLCQAVEGW